MQSAAMAKVVNTATNLGALLVFGFGGYMAITLALANVVGTRNWSASPCSCWWWCCARSYSKTSEPLAKPTTATTAPTTTMATMNHSKVLNTFSLLALRVHTYGTMPGNTANAPSSTYTGSAA